MRNVILVSSAIGGAGGWWFSWSRFRRRARPNSAVAGDAGLAQDRLPDAGHLGYGGTNGLCGEPRRQSSRWREPSDAAF